MVSTVVTSSPTEAAEFLRNGEVVAFPTETVYGLGADALDASAVAKIFEAKGRPADNPLIVHVARIDDVTSVAADVPDHARRFVDAFWPGALTLVLRKHPDISKLVTAGLETVGVRMPADAVAHEFLLACCRPVAAPSANRSGRPSPTTTEAVLADLDGRIACVLRGGQSVIGLESTVLDCSVGRPTVLRAGAVTLEELRRVDATVVLESDRGDVATPRSPGTKYRHYAPRADVRIVGSPEGLDSANGAFIGLHAPSSPDDLVAVRIVPSAREYAHELFDFFRRADDAGADVIYCEAVEPVGIGRAVMDRVERAARR